MIYGYLTRLPARKGGICSTDTLTDEHEDDIDGDQHNNAVVCTSVW